MGALDLQLLAGMLLSAPVVFLVARSVVAAGYPVAPHDARLGHIDGLRAVLALAVLGHHFVIWTNVLVRGQPWRAPAVHLFDNLGKGAVAIFFMITGAVFYPRVVAGFDRVNWTTLYASRAFRILPLSIGVTATVAVASATIAGTRNDAAPLHLLRVALDWVVGRSEPPFFGFADSARMNAAVMWSLGYEWLFYLGLLPLASAASMAMRGRAAPAALPVLLLAGALALLAWKPDLAPASYLMLFALGMLVAEASKAPSVRRRLGGAGAAVAATVATLVAMTVCASPYHPVLVAVYALLLLTVASGNGLFGLLSSRTARAMGAASFSIYMLHGLVLYALLPRLEAAKGVTPAAWLPPLSAATVLLSMVSYLAFEKPMIELGKRIGGWRPRRDQSLAVEAAP